MSLPPQSFVDNRGKVWNIQINMGKAMEIEKVDFSVVTKLQVSFLDPPKEFWTELYSRVGLRFALVYYLCRDQIKANLGIDPYASPQENDRAEYEFKKGIDGSNKEAILKALHEALSDFFPEEKTGLELARANWEKTRLLVESQIPQLAPKMDKMVERRVKDMYTRIGNALDSDNAEEVQRILTVEFGKMSSLSSPNLDSPDPNAST